MPEACVWKRCPGCYFRWLDKYSFDECPKCLSQLSKVQEQEELYASGASANMAPLWSLTTSQKMQRWSSTLRDTLHSGRTPRHNPSIATRSPNPKQQRRTSLHRAEDEGSTPHQLGSLRCAWTAASPTANSTAVGTPASVSTSAPGEERADCEALPASYVQAGSAKAKAETLRRERSLKAGGRPSSTAAAWVASAAASSSAALSSSYEKEGRLTAADYAWDAPSYATWRSHMERTMSAYEQASTDGRMARGLSSSSSSYGEARPKGPKGESTPSAQGRYSVLSAFAGGAQAEPKGATRSEEAWAEEVAIAKADAAAARAEALAAQAQVASAMAEFKRLQALIPQLAALD